MTKKRKSKQVPIEACKPRKAGVKSADTLAPTITLATAPSAQWLTEMLMKRLDSATEEYRAREWDSSSFSRDEILLHEAGVVLYHYNVARLAIERAADKTVDPLRLEEIFIQEIFTKDQLENGVEFGSKNKPGWPEIVTGYDTRKYALQALKDWVDWEQAPGPEWARRAPQSMGKKYNMEFSNGKEWLEFHSSILNGWKSCREVYLLKIQFGQYQEFLKWEKEAKEQWIKRRKKVLGETSGKNSAEAGKKVIPLGKSAQSRTPTRKRK